MVKWLAKRIETEEVWDSMGVLITPYSLDGYELKMKVNSNQRPSSKYDIIEGPDIPVLIAKIQKDTKGKWEVVEDSSKKTARNQLKSDILSAESFLDSINWADITTVAKLKMVVKQLVKHYREK